MIICAAVKFYVKKTDKYVVVPCLRHLDAHSIMYYVGLDDEDCCNYKEGFITNNGDFLDRQEAYQHALECGQLPKNIREHSFNQTLFSEDLY